MITTKQNRTFKAASWFAGLALVAIVWQPSVRAAQLPVALGSDATFGVLAGSTVTSTGGTIIDGDLGISPGTALVGAPVVTGTTHLGDATAATAQVDLTTAYNDAAGRNVAPITVAGNIGGQTLAPGLYKSTSSLAISSGDLTLDAGGDTNAVWIFQIGSTLVTTSGRQVILTGGAQSANVFWQVGTSATIGSGSIMVGTIMADQSITLVTGATLDGRALARSGAVTLDTVTLVVPGNTDVVIPPGTNGVATAACQTVDYDFDDDLASDLTVYNPASGNWYIQQSGSAGSLRQLKWGWDAAIPVAADYDGDSIADVAVYYPGSGTWYILRSSDGQMVQKQWGWDKGYPVPGDYDGDGKADLAVYNPASGTWYISKSSDGQLRQEQWGWSEVIPVPGDYDGDGTTDLAVYFPHTWTPAMPADDTNRPMWYIHRSSDATLEQVRFGYCVNQAMDPVQADYDGDCTTDIALYDPNVAVWYISRSTDSQLHQEQWGFPGAVPAAADYDGDGKVDITVYNPSTGDWYIHQSLSGALRQVKWGWSEAQPVTLRQQVSHRLPSFY